MQQGTHIYSGPHITLSFQIATQIKTIQLWSLKNHRGNRSVQSHRGVWISGKQRGGLRTERTRWTRCFLSLPAWWGSPTDRGQAETDEHRTRCAGPRSTVLKRNMLQFNRRTLQETLMRKMQLRQPHLLKEKHWNVYPDVGHPHEDCKTSRFRL